VVAIINQNEATLKKIYKLKNTFKLQPANQNMLPIYTNEIEIRGVLVKTIHNNQSQTTLKTLDLFAGIGGIRLGFERNGFETVFSNDFDENCKKTYDLNFKTSKLITEDITKIGINDLPEFDFLLAGFPCQAFSIAGYRQGFRDEKGRGNLFFDIARIIDARRPKGFLLENVKNLISHDNGKTFKIIIQTLENLGYYVKYKILNSMNYGNVPQNRERIYIVGLKDKKAIERFSFPEPIELETKINDFLEENVDNKYYYNDKPLYEKLKDFVKEENKIYQWRRQYVRENKKGVCPTLTANMGTGGHNVPIIKDKKGIRKLTPLECFRLQGFPKKFVLPKLADSILYKQAGNSVTIPVIERIAEKIKETITN
jgi:DNA (cytosine-5)-methyltransferase 1